MSDSVLDSEDASTLEYIITHVFCPLQLPDKDDYSTLRDYSLVGMVASAARLYAEHVEDANAPDWNIMLRMLDNLRATVKFSIMDTSQSISQLCNMNTGDVVAFIIRAQNAAVVFRKQRDDTIIESFEVSPKAENVMTTRGKLMCSYPGPAIEIPNAVFCSRAFIPELVNFLIHMDGNIINDFATSEDAKSSEPVLRIQDISDPRYITELLTGILRSVGRPADIVRICKRVGDDAMHTYSGLPWRRSSLWLTIRVVLQTSLHRSALGNVTYKNFMVFFMCRLATEKISATLSNDLLRFMSAKISRRLGKLGSAVPDWLSSTVLETCASLRSVLEERWEKAQAALSGSPVWTPSHLDLVKDIQLSLRSSGGYLQDSLAAHRREQRPPTQESQVTSSHPVSIPSHHRRGTLDDFLSRDGAFFAESYRTDPHVTLYDVERAVEEGIDGWVDQVTDSDDACIKLEILANKYSSVARKAYENNPELQSVMLLTTIELWVALDKIVIKAIHILADYSPEVPMSLLEDLVLCKPASLRRLRSLYRYLSSRHSQSKWSVFSPTITVDSFAVRFYHMSFRLQSLKARIEEAAQHKSDEKVAELERASARYDELEWKAIRDVHEFAVDQDELEQDGRKRHVSGCKKCSIEREYKSMRIAVYEWPLPTEPLLAETVVFELDCPVSFNTWRSATLHLLVDLCTPSESIDTKSITTLLSGYNALRPYHVRQPRSRVTLASNSVPNNSELSFPTTREHVCVENGLTFYGYDGHAHIFSSKVLDGVNIKKYCTYMLPSGPYRKFQRYVDGTCHSSNEVLANQADCSKDISIHEYTAFGHLRSGGLLQWLNILRELRGRSLTFRRHEVHFLLAQAVSQVGPLENLEWLWHREIQQQTFCYVLLGELESLVQDVESNWLEVVAMDSISFLLRRLLTSNSDQAVSFRVTELLCTVRSKVFSWVEQLSAELTKTPGDKEFRGFLRDAAVVCRSTFDVDPVMIPDVLRSAKDIEAFIICSIFIHDNTPSNPASFSTYSRLLLDRDRRLSLAVEKALSGLLQADSSDEGINMAVCRVWPDYRPGSKWTPLDNPDSRWLSCTTAPTDEQRSQVVHYNLLDGSLLVDEKPLGRLPSKILRHPVYNLIFGNQILDVIPSDLQGMDYSTRSMISNHQIHFAFRNKDLIIRAKTTAASRTEFIELIPREKIEDDLPAAFIEEHVHWLNLSTATVEIRPVANPWESSSENWKIHCSLGQYYMQKGHEFLVDIRSKTWDMISTLLRPLDTPQNLIISTSVIQPTHPSPSQLCVVLPRYRLSFQVDEDGDIQSNNIRGMVFDEDQSIGTLFGLVNRLVLRSKAKHDNAVELVPRIVIIPDGNVSFRKNGHHVRVDVNTNGSIIQRVTYQTYRIDTDLGCLKGTVSLTNKLYCAYLHALTSGCGTDPLTGRLGTEEAVSLLQSAGCWSITKLTPRDAGLLKSIASLHPSRTGWLGSNRLVDQQSVEWLDLPVTSQHCELFVVCNAIKEHYEKIELFQESRSSDLFARFPTQDSHLLERSARRASYLFPTRVSERLHGKDFDVQYTARDLVGNGPGELRAYTVATSIVHPQTANTETTKNFILNMLESWTGTINGDIDDSKLSLSYDRSWLSPNLPLIWLKAYNLLRTNDDEKWVQLLFSIPAMVYASPKYGDLASVFVAFASYTPFHSEVPPSYDSYDISDGYYPSPVTLRNYVSRCAHPFESSPESSETATRDNMDEEAPSIADLRHHQHLMYLVRLDSEADAAVAQVLNDCQWPCETFPPCSLNPDLYNVADFMSNGEKHFSSCYRNHKLREHLICVQKILDDLCSEAVLEEKGGDTAPSSNMLQGFAPWPSNTWSPIPPTSDNRYSFCPSKRNPPSHAVWSFTMDQLFDRPAPSLQGHDRLPRRTADVRDTKSLFDINSLQKLIDAAEENAINIFQRQYISALRESAECLVTETSLARGDTTILTIEELLEHYRKSRNHYVEALKHLKECLCPRSPSEQAFELSGQWPRITAYTLFRSLASNSQIQLSAGWRECLTVFVLLALDLQRARRLLSLRLDNRQEEFQRELENEGCDGWDAATHPDWLLIQLQGNFLVRRVQAEVANEMISPCSGDNTAMQLNMGEGKSSVIVPIVAVALANGEQFVRVVVPKSLTVQTFHSLIERLGGLTNRRIYLLPFSRSIRVDNVKVTALQELMSECMRERGIMIVQPEHLLSLKLVSVEKQLPQTQDRNVGALLLNLQQWLHFHARDVLDESDEVLHVRYQLAYTIGTQQQVEGSPDRWTTAEQVLGLVKKHAFAVWEKSPYSVEYEPASPSGSFPHLRILDEEAGKHLIKLVVQDVMNDILPNFNFGQFIPGIRNAIRNFISCDDVSPGKVQMVKDHVQHTSLWTGLLHLRGLFAMGVLSFSLSERRWRVDYGLAPSRTMLAVPYRAKDVPAPRAEFGHPDICIILTCLSYYYGGLTEEQLRLSFEMLLKEEDPSPDYYLWIKDSPDIPDRLRTLSNVNTKSSEQWKKDLVPLFSRNQATIDFYLSSVVFPKEAMEFPSRLSCSGWDLAEKKERLLTGFSGTNDGQYLLPLHITQRDPDHQRGTNAKVLSYILQPENDHYTCTSHTNGERRSTSQFLEVLVSQKPDIRVLLDVGAQMLDLRNWELAKAWLDINRDASAAIYFDDNDELTVCARDGSTQLLLSSPFAQQLDQCVIYLDDAHTRGTDIKFPNGFRAAVTLGPKLTKDRLVQGCMRMRKLGHGHSIMFFAPLEVDRRIRDLANKDSLDDINTMDILHWVIRETCDDIQRRAPIWAQQGTEHTVRYEFWASFCKGKLTSKEVTEKWIQPGSKTMEDLYDPFRASSHSPMASSDIENRCRELGITSMHGVNMGEEEERELSHEAEREQLLERPPKVPAEDHSIHQDIVHFIMKGVVPPGSNAFRQAFETLDATSAVTSEAHVWSSNLLTTADFERTVKLNSGKLDEYLRPVQWIVSGIGDYKELALVIFSPHEVNYFLPSIRSSKNVHLHLYTPRTSKSTEPCDDLDFYNIPTVPARWTPSSSLMDQLNVFAGQLYLTDHEAYIRLCRFLCVRTRDLQDDRSVVSGCDGFILPNNRRHLPGLGTFQCSPLAFLKTLMGLRRKGMRFAPTHMGLLLDGRLLSEDDFDDADDVSSSSSSLPTSVGESWLEMEMDESDYGYDPLSRKIWRRNERMKKSQEKDRDENRPINRASGWRKIRTQNRKMQEQEIKLWRCSTEETSVEVVD